MTANSSGRIVQTMTLSRDEFDKSIAALDAEAKADVSGGYKLAAGQGQVIIRYSALPGVTLGRLLALPRAEVSLDFEGLSGPEREAFFRRYEIAFQRGGG